MQLIRRVGNFSANYWYFVVPIALSVFAIAFISWNILREFDKNELLTFSFCITESCLNVVKDNFGSSLLLIDWIFKTLAVWVTVVSLVLGIKTYQLSNKNSELSEQNSIINNHINNFKMFCDFIDSEIDESRLIKRSKINVYSLYSLIFPNSMDGRFREFVGYQGEVAKVRSYLISASNDFKYMKGGPSKTFDYMMHQERVMKLFIPFGISLDKMHRNDFYMIEDELIQFIDVITKTFTDLPVKKLLLSSINRHYR